MLPYGYDSPPVFTKADLRRGWDALKTKFVRVRGWLQWVLWGRLYARMTVDAFTKHLAADWRREQRRRT